MKTYAEVKAQALASIAKQIAGIKYEGPEDEGAMEWQGHLESVQKELEAGTMGVEDAEDSLGVYLVDAEERRKEDERRDRRTNFAAFGGN